MKALVSSSVTTPVKKIAGFDVFVHKPNGQFKASWKQGEHNCLVDNLSENEVALTVIRFVKTPAMSSLTISR